MSDGPEVRDSPSASSELADEPRNLQTRTRPPTSRRQGLKRSSAACQRCRRRKQKVLPFHFNAGSTSPNFGPQCDGKLPTCRPCAAAGADCVPSERLVIRVDPNCDCDVLRKQIQTLKAEVDNLQARLATDKTTHPAALDGSVLSTGRAAQQALLLPLEEQDITDLSSSWERFYSGRMIFPTFSGTSKSGAPDTSFLSSPWHLWDGLSAAETPADAIDPRNVPLIEYGLELIEIFFARRWPQFPVLHKPTFLEKHYHPYAGGEALDRLSSFQVNIVLAIGASEKSRAKEGCQFSPHDFFQLAIRDLGSVLAADDLSCIQCLLLLCIFGSNEPQSVNLWYTVGLALRLAVGIDLHRQETVGSKSLLEAQMCKRLFWSLYTMDRSISIAMGRPLGIQDADITMPLPLSLSDRMLEQPAEQPFLSVGPVADDLSTFLHIIELRRINADIYKALHSAGDTNIEDNSIDAIRIRYYSQLNGWLVSAPRYVAPTSMFQTPEWFQIAYHQAIMNLYRPSHASPVSTLDAIRLCADSSISLVSNYSALYAKNKVTYTFVALTSLFMAAVTMLYSLRASSILRQELTRDVVESNIETCMTLLRNISNGRAVGERSVQIIKRLGNATLAIFDSQPEVDNEVDTEFMSWFGLKCQHPPEVGQPTPSIDLPWNDLFKQGFDFGGLYCSDLLI
jgi:hypothetical protein